MNIKVQDFENIVKSPHFLHLTSINSLLLKKDRVLTRYVEYSVHKGQNSLYDNSCKSDAQVDIYLKVLLNKSNPVVFLLIPRVN